MTGRCPAVRRLDVLPWPAPAVGLHGSVDQLIERTPRLALGFFDSRVSARIVSSNSEVGRHTDSSVVRNRASDLRLFGFREGDRVAA
jgi:hypothetical protein